VKDALPLSPDTGGCLPTTFQARFDRKHLLARSQRSQFPNPKFNRSGVARVFRLNGSERRVVLDRGKVASNGLLKATTLAVDLHENLAQVPFPVRVTTHRLSSSLKDF